MSTITVPITKDLESFIEEEVNSGASESKAHLVRSALIRLREEKALARLTEAENDIKERRVYKGSLRALASKMK